MPPRSSLQAMADRNSWINKCLGPFAPWIVWHWGVCSTPFPRITSGTELTLSPVVTSWGFLGGSDGKESACNAGDLGLTPRLGRSPRGEHGNPLQYSCLENPHGQWCLVGYSAWGCKESDMIEQLSTAQWLHARALFIAFFFSSLSHFFTPFLLFSGSLSKNLLSFKSLTQSWHLGQPKLRQLGI